MDVKQFKIGQIVWLVPTDRQRYKKSEPIEYKIVKIGRKYLEVKKDELEHWEGVKFDVTDDFKHFNKGYSADWKIYFSLQSIEDEKESEKLAHKIREVIGNWGIPRLTLQQLRDIDNIISK